MKDPGQLRNRYNERDYWVRCILLGSVLLADCFCPDHSNPVIGPSSAYIPLGSIHFLPSTHILLFQINQLDLGYNNTQFQVGNRGNGKYSSISLIGNLKRGIDNTKEQNREREKSTEIEVYQVYGSGDLSMG